MLGIDGLGFLGLNVEELGVEERGILVKEVGELGIGSAMMSVIGVVKSLDVAVLSVN